jgi:uncharacterized membrane protein
VQLVIGIAFAIFAVQAARGKYRPSRLATVIVLASLALANFTDVLEFVLIYTQSL